MQRPASPSSSLFNKNNLPLSPGVLAAEYLYDLVAPTARSSYRDRDTAGQAQILCFVVGAMKSSLPRSSTVQYCISYVTRPTIF